MSLLELPLNGQKILLINDGWNNSEERERENFLSKEEHHDQVFFSSDCKKEERQENYASKNINASCAAATCRGSRRLRYSYSLQSCLAV